MNGMELYRDILQTVVKHEDLSFEQSFGIFTALMDGELTEVQVAGLLLAMAVKGPAVEESAGAAQAMRDHAVKIPTGGADVVDIVGTGGTGLSTFNISTTTSFVAAGAGLKIAKHGNITNTRASGSANILTALGVNIEASPEVVGKSIAEAGMGFCFARTCHPAMKFAVPVRKQLPVGTIFNILGPMTNPAGATRQIMGVYSDELTEPLAAVLKRLGAQRVMVVHGADGLDELSITGETRVSELKDGEITTYTLTPADAGLQAGKLEELLVDSPEASAARCRAILTGEKTGASRDIVLLNAAAALMVADQAADLTDGVAQARESITSGSADAALEKLIAITNA